MMVKKLQMATDPLNSDRWRRWTRKQMQIPTITVLVSSYNQTETPDATWTAADCDSDGVRNYNGTDPLNAYRWRNVMVKKLMHLIH
jgi:hypothetical protein